MDVISPLLTSWLDGFSWRDGDRRVQFGRGALAQASQLLDDDYVLLTTSRARDAAPAIAAAARDVVEVRAGRVDDLAATIGVAPADARLLVALGGGRVVDVAKAVAAATRATSERDVRVAAIPTTLSAAEMTHSHRIAPGLPADTTRVRPAIVINDPALSASAPTPLLAASAANALGHAVEGAACAGASPVPGLIAAGSVQLLAAADPGPDALALGALLSGCVTDATGVGLHHVLSQTLARSSPAAHAQANAAMLPHTVRALRERTPDVLGALDDAAGRSIEAVAAQLAQRAQAQRLRDLGVAREQLPALAADAAGRDELRRTPPIADERELLELYEAAW